MIEQWILVVNSLSVITAIFLINFNDPTSGLLMSLDVWVDEEFGEMSSSWQGSVDRGSCWYSTRVFLIHICNVQQCSKLFRQGSSRLLFGSNLAYHDNFIITDRYHWPPSQIKWFAVSVSYLFSHRIHTAVWPERSGVRWLHYCCWHQTTVSLGLRLSSPPLSAVMLEWCTSHQLTLLN